MRGAGLAALLLTGCTSRAPERVSADAARTDSIFRAADSRIGDSLVVLVPDAVKAEVFSASEDSRSIVRDFLRRLPADSTRPLQGLAYSGDSAFLYLPDNVTLDRTRESFVLGEVLRGYARRMVATVLEGCAAGSSCQRKISTMTREERASAIDARAVSRPDVEAFLASGFTQVNSPYHLVEKSAPAGHGFIAETKCDNGTATIRYADDLDRRFSPIGFAFFRAHEFAHVALNHVPGCLPRGMYEPDPAVTLPRREFDADCMAAQILIRSLPASGVSVVMFAAGQFSLLALPNGDYPPWRARSDSLFRPACSG